MARKKKGDPELLLVSFCDIVTVVCVSLFMAMIIVIDMAMKTPEILPTPFAAAVTNAPIYFECRNNQVYPVDRDGISKRVQESSRRLGTDSSGAVGRSENALRQLMQLDLGNEYYKVSNNHLMMGIIALRPKPDVAGIPLDALDKEGSPYLAALKKVNPNSQYLAFLVRDDSFKVFRKAREMAVAAQVLSGFEYLDREEPITFAGMMGRVATE